MMHHTKRDALSMKFLGWPAITASLAGKGGGREAGVAPVMGIALELLREMIQFERLSRWAVWKIVKCWCSRESMVMSSSG